MLYPLSFLLLPLDINLNSQFSNPNCDYPIMANADVSSPSPEPQRAKRPPDMVVPPPPTPPVDGESLMDTIDGQEERKEEDCDLANPDLENTAPLHAGSDILSEGKAVCGDDSSFEKAVLVEKPIGDEHVNKLEVKEESDLPLMKLDTSTPEQPMGECQAVKSGSERKRKSHDGTKHIESLFGRRLTRSNSRIVTKGVNNCQKIAKRITRSQKSSPADYLGNDVDIAGIERALKRLTRTGSKRVLQEPAADNGLLNSPCENTGDCIVSDLPYSDGSSDVVNKGVNIIEDIMETFQENEIQPVCVEFPTQEIVNMEHQSDELDGNNGSKEADVDIEIINETDAVIPMEVSGTAVEISIAEDKLEKSILDTPSKRLTRSALRNAQLELTEFSGSESSMHETKGAEQSIVPPVEECSKVVEVSTAENKLDSSKLVTPSKRLTRSAMKNEQLHATSVPDFGSSRDEPILKNENMEEQKQIAEEFASCSVDKSADLVKIEKSGLEVPSKRLTRSALKNAQMDITPFLGFRSTIDEPISESPEAKKIEVAQVSIDGSSHSNTVKLGNAEFVTSPKRVTRSTMKNAHMVSSELELPSRRFTRSQMKCSVSYDDEEEDEDGDGVDVSEPERATRKVSCSSQKGNRPTMSGRCKKFDLVKPPSNARELLATGFLEGLDVMYIVPNSKKPVLKGMIKGGSILCFCSACKGYRAVSAYNFEVHAGSTKKHPSDFIFLENGNTLRDVLRVCSNARVSDLETSLRNEVGSVPRKNLRACLKCGSHLTPDVHRFFLCDSCSHTNQLLAPCDSSLSMSQSPFTIGRSPIPVPSQSTVEMLSKVVPSPTLSLSASAKRSNTVGRLTRKNIGLHKLVFTCDILPEGTEVAYYVGGKRLLDGYIKEGAIFCHCCSAVVSPSQFEAHAGQSSRRKPYNNIYTSNGVSLHELSVSLSKHKMVSQGATDDLCSICYDSGDLIICDYCPRAFHKDCVGLTEIPEGDWSCQYCVSLHRRDNCVASNDNARAAGRVEGVDPIEQIFKRCIRIVSISETDLGGCTICKLHDFSQLGFDDRTVILCDQCQREYHVGCLRDCKKADLKELPEGEWFCSLDCSIMHGALKEVILSGPQSLTSCDIELIKRKSEAKGASANENENKKELVDYDNIRWRLLSGASAQEVEAQLLSGAVSIFHESFDPIIDAKSKIDLIPAMVNGMSIEGHQDYSGMYCAVITIGSKVVSAGLLRVFGTDAAELPLVATSRDLQGLGYFQALFACMERMLIDLKVRHFLLPAAEEAESIWTKKFGFSRIPSDQVEDYLKGAHLTAFRGTASLHKPLFI